MKNRIAACLLAISIFATTAVTASAASNGFNASAAPDHVTLTWNSDPMTTQTITWRTTTTVQSSFVQYDNASASAFPSGAKQVTGTSSVCSTELGDESIHTVTLTGLSSGTKYIYRVGDGTNWSSKYTFTTEASNTQSFKFLLFGDSQSGIPTNPEYGPWKTTIQNAFAANKDAKFFMNAGDLVETGYYDAHWENWFSAAAGVIDTIPIMPVQGNHETYEDATYNVTGKPVLFTSQFILPQNGPQGLKGQTYSFNYGNVHFVVLDSQEAEEKAVNGSILDSQKNWLEQDLSSNTQRWTIVLMHKTIYYNKATRTNEDIKAAFQPIFDKHHVDIVFDGHDHDYSRTYPMYNDSIVSSPAKGTVYICTGRSGNKFYSDLSAKVWDAFFYDPQDQPNYLSVQLNGDKLTVMASKQDGTPIDTYSIDKNSGMDSPQTVVPGKANVTRLSIYGNLLQTPQLMTAPSQINGKWYVPARSFVDFLGGNVTWNSDNASVSLNCGSLAAQIQQNSSSALLNGGTVTLPDTVTKNTSGVTMISADDINQLFGFSYKYDSSLNVLMFTK